MATEARTVAQRRREQQRSAIRDASRSLLEVTPFAELRVDDIARAAGISRPAFYFYFKDKRDLLMSLTGEVSDALLAEAERWWHGEGEPRTLVSQMLAGIASVYARHRTLLRVATEVSTYDHEMGRFWTTTVDRFVAPTAARLQEEQRAGRLLSQHPDRTAEALVWMVERCAYVYLAMGQRSEEELVATLTDVWLAALYPADDATP